MFEREVIIFIGMDLALNNLQCLICHKTQTTYLLIFDLISIVCMTFNASLLPAKGRCSQKPLFGRSQEPMYGTRPWCLVQAITRHTCPDPHLGSWNCLPHHSHIAPSEPMSSTDQQGSSLDSFPTFPLPYPHFNRPSGFWPCVKSCLVGGSDKYSLLPPKHKCDSRVNFYFPHFWLCS